jgi:glycosyltransferase involved in cell wall biosynthesis
MKQEVEARKLTNYFRFCGKILDRDFLQMLIICSFLNFFPSRFDTSSLTIYESACNKVPTLGIDKTETTSEIINDVNGFTVDFIPLHAANKIIAISSDVNLYTQVSEKCLNDFYRS